MTDETSDMNLKKRHPVTGTSVPARYYNCLQGSSNLHMVLLLSRELTVPPGTESVLGLWQLGARLFATTLESPRPHTWTFTFRA
jgi:hypothetical protein